MSNTESMEEAVQRQLMGKRRRPEDWGESEAKKPQYESIREAPFHRVEDGVRIITEKEARELEPNMEVGGESGKNWMMILKIFL